MKRDERPGKAEARIDGPPFPDGRLPVIKLTIITVLTYYLLLHYFVLRPPQLLGERLLTVDDV